jgi:dihydrofolate synthase/folylpolyglutamate synthase
MTYKEVTEFLFNQFPQFQKVGADAYKPGLERITSICNGIANPQDKLEIIHIAGTNGKGSVCHMLGSILQESGFRVGIFSSPHLVDFRERFRINGEMISEEEVISFVQSSFDEFSKLNASFFEWSTALAFHYFAKEEVDFAIIETGLGGRLDSTNIVKPILTAITHIGIDHTAYLGNTIELIAKEKAGIIKKGIPNVLGINILEVNAIINKTCLEQGSICIEAKLYLDEPFRTDLKGDYQKENIATVLAIVDQLRGMGHVISPGRISAGLLNVKTNTNFRGRWELLQNSPRVIADIGHNTSGIKFIAEQLANDPAENLHIVFGMVSDKDIATIVEMLPKKAKYYLCSPNIQRAFTVEKLAEFFKDFKEVTTYNSCNQAYTNALSAAGRADLIFVGGSNFVVAEIISDFF